MAARFNEQHTTAVLVVDKSIYSKAAILRACYWLGRDLYFQISDDESQFQITAALRVSSPTLAEPVVKKIDQYVPELLNALIDSQLRVEIQNETENIRELIIAKAFAESGVLEDAPPGTFDDPVSASNDPNSLVKIEPSQK